MVFRDLIFIPDFLQNSLSEDVRAEGDALAKQLLTLGHSASAKHEDESSLWSEPLRYGFARSLLFILFFHTAIFGALDGWEYKLGNSPVDSKGEFIWTKDDDLGWSSIPFPSNPIDRENAINAWFRVKLPDVRLKDPVLYIYSIDLISEVYFEGRLIYSFGEFGGDGGGSFAGWPWHFIELPQDFAGKTLTFRVWSDAKDIGLWGEVELGDKAGFITKMLRRDMPRVAVGAVAIFVGSLLMLLFFNKLQFMGYFYLSLLFLTQGVDLVVSTQIKQLLLFYPLFFQFLLAFCYFFFPIGVALFTARFVDKRGKNILKAVYLPHTLFLIFALPLSIVNVMHLSSAYEWFDMLYYFFSLPLLLLYLGYSAFRGGIEAKALFTAFLTLAGFYLYSTLVASGFLSWTPYPTYVGVMIFLGMLSLILTRRYVLTYKRLEIETKKREEQEKIILEQSKMAFMGEMLGAITHQWAQPLTAINFALEDLDDEEKSVKIIKNQVAFMGSTLKSFKNFIKPSSKKEVFTLLSVIEQALIIMDSRLKKISVRITTDISETEVIFGKKEDLLQVFMVLFHNSIDAICDNNIEEGEIKIVSYTTKDVVTIEVSDNGGGIKEDVMDKLFEKSVTTKGDYGTGVGLGLVKLILTRVFEGSISHRNTEKGALFTIKIPNTYISLGGTLDGLAK